jgi:site-specific recombinase XerC
MLVQRVLSPASSLESWTVLGDDDLPVAAIERYLAYLTDIERSPNTVKAYAHDLKDYFTFLDGRGLDWREVRLEDVGEFVAWLRQRLEAAHERNRQLTQDNQQLRRQLAETLGQLRTPGNLALR